MAPIEGVAQHVDINTTHKDKKKAAAAPTDKPADAPKSILRARSACRQRA